jgi:hypothetical protein
MLMATGKSVVVFIVEQLHLRFLQYVSYVTLSFIPRLLSSFLNEGIGPFTIAGMQFGFRSLLQLLTGSCLTSW